MSCRHHDFYSLIAVFSLLQPFTFSLKRDVVGVVAMFVVGVVVVFDPSFVTLAEAKSESHMQSEFPVLVA